MVPSLGYAVCRLFNKGAAGCNRKRCGQFGEVESVIVCAGRKVSQAGLRSAITSSAA
jgi:hypothetical protein